MRVRIHRGAAEIGGNCVEVESGDARIVLDVGRPLDADQDELVPLPPVAGFSGSADPSLLGVLISHPHQDHWGLAPQLPKHVPIYTGEAAARLLREAAFFSRGGVDLKPAGFLRDRQPIRLGPFTVTPYLVDHSAFDAYALLVEADGQRLFYTGDFRGHGPKAKLFERFVQKPPKDVDVLLMEGTMVHEAGVERRSETTEKDVERRCIERFKATAGMALVTYSSQNIDRLVTLYKAALQSDRDLVLDLYTATLARATGTKSIPQPGPGWPRVRVFVPLNQRLKVKNTGEFERVNWLRKSRLFPEHLPALAGRLVMTFRSSMAKDMEKAGCLEGASLTWSLWNGYLAKDKALRRFTERNGIPIAVEHSSGHAFVGDLRRLVDALRPARVVPIHTMAPLRMSAVIGRDADVQPDSRWWHVRSEVAAPGGSTNESL